MQRSTLTLALALFVGCAPASPPSTVAAHQPGRVLGAHDLGAVDRLEIIDLVISLRLRQPDALAAFLTAQRDRGSSRFQERVLPAAFAEQYGATVADYERLAKWATDSGLEVVRRVPSRSTLTVRGNAATVEAAFGTHLRLYSDGRGVFRAPTVELTGWRDISDLAQAVIGLDTAGQWHSHRVPDPPVPNRTSGSLDPVDLNTIYNSTGVANPGQGQTVAILGTGFAPDPLLDVGGFVKKYKLATSYTQQYTQVFVGGPNRDNDMLANTEYGENLLDVDMVLGMAPYASVVHVFTAVNGGGLFADGISFIVNQVPNAHSVSLSYGSCERVAAFEVLTLNQLFQQAKAEGQQWFSSSGDNGTDGCRDGNGNRVLSVDWPSSSPFMMGVGGTDVSGTNGETAWAGGGGGESEINAKPAFQVGVGPYPNDGVRDVPDIAAVAGNPGVSTYSMGQVFGSQGTSAAAPIWAGCWALIDQAKGGTGITNGAERIYELGLAQQAGGAVVFHDIVAGSNPGPATQGYPALPGYDLVTGWGTPDVANLIANW